MILKSYHDIILTEALYPFHILTGEQVTEVLYAPGSVKRVKGYLKELTDAEYIQAFPVLLGSGPPMYTYALAERGKQWLKMEHGIDVPFSYRSPMATPHTLELNKFLIAAKNLEYVAPLRPHMNSITNELAAMPSAFVSDIQHDFLLKTAPIRAITPEGKHINIVPDALLNVSVRAINSSKRTRRVLIIELERDTHRSKPFQQKLQGYLDAISEQSLQAYIKTYNFRICYVSTIGTEHVEKMRRLAREVLLKNFSYIDTASVLNMRFRFAAIPPLRGMPVDSFATFLQPYWYVPFGEKDARYICIDI